jgi:uncharacterized membrane protein
MRLIAVPEYGWPRLSAACDRGESLPAPLTHALMLGAVAVVATMLGSLISPARSFDETLLATFIAAVGYGGAAVSAVVVAAPRLQVSPRLQQHTARFASAACLPVLASGIVNVIPLGLLGVVAAVGGALMTYWSAFVGARDLLGLEDKPRKDAALLVCVFSGLPTLVCTSLLWLV